MDTPVTDITYTRAFAFGTGTGWTATLGPFTAHGKTKGDAKAQLLGTIAKLDYQEPVVLYYRDSLGIVYHTLGGFAYSIYTCADDVGRPPAICLLGAEGTQQHAIRRLRVHLAQQHMTAEDPAADVILDAQDLADHLRYHQRAYSA